MATSLVDDMGTEGFVELRAVSDEGPQQTRAEWLWTFFGATLLSVFLSYVALTP